MNKRRDMPYRYWRWWVSMIFLWPLVIIAFIFILLQKSLFLMGDTLTRASEKMDRFDWLAGSRAIDKLSKWAFQE